MKKSSLRVYSLSNEGFSETFVFQFPKMTRRPLFHSERIGGYGLTDDEPSETTGVVPSVLCGERIPQNLLPLFPKMIDLKPVSNAAKKRGSFRVPDIMEFSVFVSERARGVIEEVEPGVHQFIPVKFRNADTGEVIPTQFYFFNVLNWVPADELFDLERCPSESHRTLHSMAEDSHPRTTLFINYLSRNLVFRRKWFETSILVREGSVLRNSDLRISGNAILFVREEFRRAAKAARLTGLSFGAARPCVA
ncbi:MAG TPA: DUF1629 domain-containing protein [Vineibacter sp.]|nr:DUF1629 domain-containing protein [Vineibacter sp.]